MHLPTERYQLGNGIILLHCHNQNLPIVSVNAFIRAGKDQNLGRQPGLASLTSRLLDEGTQTYSCQALSELIENAGGEISTFSERELTGVCLQLNASDLALGTHLLSEMVIHPTFPEDRFRLERRKVLNHIQSMNDDPEAVGSQVLNHWIYQGSPLREPVLGDRKSLDKLTVEDLIQFHRHKYGPQNTILTVVGDVKFTETVDLVTYQFAGWSNPHLELKEPPRVHRQTEPYVDTKPMAKEQSTIYIGHLGIERMNPDFYALQVVDAILGGGPCFTSRIPRELRDNQGLAYAAYSDLTGSSGLYPGRFSAYVCTSPENRERACKALLFEIFNLVDGGVSAEELELAKEFLTGNFVFEFQGNTSIARYLLARELFQLEEDYPQRYVEAVRAVDRSEAHRVARQYLDTVNYTTVIVGSV